MDFAKFITDLDHGAVHQRLGEELETVVQGVHDVGGTGKLTVTFTVKKEGRMAAVTVSSSHKAPREPMHGTLFHFSAQGADLSREDPRQLKMKTIAAQELKDV